jgi:hypothetical protein
MSRFVILTAVGFIATIASARADEQVWTVDNWPADVNQDGKINVLDLILVRNAMGTSCP